jgi:prepilin peptidase CpaA
VVKGFAMTAEPLKKEETMLLDIILFSVLAICLVTDLEERKIYNKVIFPSLLVTIALQFAYGGLAGLKLSLLGFIIGLIILIIPFLLGGMGAGDVKLLALIGAVKGSTFVLNTAIYMALLGGAIALLVIIFQKQTISLIKILFFWIVSLFSGVKYKLEFPTSFFSKKYPYGVAIVGGALICLLFKGAWII